MGGACCSKDDKPTFSFKDCLQNINIKSSCFSSCCVKGDSKIESKKEHIKNKRKEYYEANKKDNQ